MFCVSSFSTSSRWIDGIRWAVAGVGTIDVAEAQIGERRRAQALMPMSLTRSPRASSTLDHGGLAGRGRLAALAGFR